MSRPHSQYVCQQCGYSQVGWSGRCPNCGVWGSLVETLIESKSASSGRKSSTGKIRAPVSLSSINLENISRISTKIIELDRVLGGGLVAGQVVLIAGEPGIGKSTLLLQTANNLGQVLYVCGEESATQIKIRSDRLGIKNKDIQLLEDTNVDSIVDTISSFPGLALKGIVIDSIQTMTTSDLSGVAGSVGQVRECTLRLIRIAKELGIPVFIVGHVTKEGTVAGPSTLAHMVDTVLWFEGDSSLTLRVIRAVKNRFGPTDEVGIFEMEDKGLISTTDPEKLFLTTGLKNVPGSVVSAVLQGTRSILVEVQSLVVPSKLAFPKRVAQGIDPKRFELLLAVVSRRCSIPLYENDCFINVAGGIKVTEPAVDLAVCLSLASTYLDKPLPKGTIAIGEVGLLGEIRQAVAQEKRIKEAKRLGFTNPITNKEVSYLGQAVNKYLKG
ncbi:DNA repair protein RadA [Candidatus Woesebacteria bacterium]|nr:DNA repair protein RadA [Candidatus Woesebacteria bacterium]